MTASDWAEISVTASGLLFTGLVSLVVVMIRLTYRWARLEGRLDALAQADTQLRVAMDQAHADIRAQQLADRDATNSRFGRLEDHLWNGTR